MSAPKVGDRVRVEFEGTVAAVPDDAGWLTILHDGDLHWTRERAGSCTVILPPVKVGDVVTADNIGQLPDWSIIAPPGRNPAQKCDGKWLELMSVAADVALVDENDILTCWTGTVVLRVGGGQS